MSGRPVIWPIIAIGALLMSPAAVAAGDEAASQSFALVGVNVIPMDEERVLTDQTVVVIDGFIRIIGAPDQTDVPDGIPTIPGRGRFLLPGFADLHVQCAHAGQHSQVTKIGHYRELCDRRPAHRSDPGRQ